MGSSDASIHVKRIAVQPDSGKGPIPKPVTHHSAQSADTSANAPANQPGSSPSAVSGRVPSIDWASDVATAAAAAAEVSPAVIAASINDKWHKAIHKVVKSVVSIQFSSVTPFDTERTYVSEATGFIVDAERGIIMTNRHVVGPGPFRGYAVFDNHEECSVDAIYRDPVHDFGFLRFDPKKVKHMKIQSLELKPENAVVGREIRVIGNDAGEKLSILAGVISRVDRNAPDYGEMNYNDFNTEYIQAAASASGGSSGSPVVDVEGHVVALQAGGSSVASTDFFLPLYRGLRALRCLQSEKPITRGTIQVKWLLRPFDECIRLGLTEEAEMQARRDHPDTIGLLVASTTLPEGPASDGKVEEGDCLLAINDKPICRFRDVDDILDSNIDQTIKLTLMRSGKVLYHDVKVQNLFEITPDRFVRVAGAVFHNLSYQIASYYAHAVKGVYVAYTGFYFNPTNTDDYTGWVLAELDDKPTPDLDAFIEVVTNIPNKKLVSGKFWHVADPHAVVTSVVNVNRQWASGPQDFELAVCNNNTGIWDFTQLGPGAPSEKLQRRSARFITLSHTDASPAVAALNNSIVRVKMLRPAMIEGYTIPEIQMHGFVIDAEQGLVLVSRLCVPHYLVDLTVVIAESVILPARVVFLHPQQGYAVIQYDPKLIDAPIKSVPLYSSADNPGTESLSQGTPLSFVGYDSKGSAFVIDTRVADIAPTMLPIGFGVPPRYRATNIDCIGVDSSIIPELDSGLLASPKTGAVRAIWLSFLGDVNNSTRRDRIYRFALDVSTLSDTIAQIREAPTKVDPRFIDLEVRSIKLATARIWKVPDYWVKRIEDSEGSRMRPELLSVARVSSSLQNYVQEGDMIVAIGDKLAINVSQLTNLPTSMESVELTIIRRGEERKIEVPTMLSSETVTKTLVSWCGMSVHKPHHAVLQQVKNPPSQVYVVSTHSGAPASMYDIYATSFVTHINGQETPDIDTFFRVVKEIPDDTYAKIRIVNFEGMPSALSIRTNYHYFPTWRIDLDLATGQWTHTD